MQQRQQQLQPYLQQQEQTADSRSRTLIVCCFSVTAGPNDCPVDDFSPPPASLSCHHTLSSSMPGWRELSVGIPLGALVPLSAHICQVMLSSPLNNRLTVNALAKMCCWICLPQKFQSLYCSDALRPPGSFHNTAQAIRPSVQTLCFA